ncbi:SGNH/GDSL hydrolase family protein [Pseudoprimorskyibacter insulae]|uniref:Uncharacterized protein n=1 Tax=Pseudoprimorskyibacter insulae TaxID=1695997 RepID=A0A2R8B0H0_9RHOB|nr:hypothetical protein [Pseudoprimorskyibacter insulae]SPF81785.1 hypothetical protein PRI8871_03610 [Pseudoprimorskyibacter insulae]
MKILVLGFSVTVENNGFVEQARARLSGPDAPVLVKTGMGGMQPYHGRYLFPSIIERHQPDAIVLDIATPAFRNFSTSQAPYKASLHSVLRTCRDQGIRLALLDLPRNDVDYADDWVTRYNAKVCARLGLPHHIVPLTDGLLRDEVHPTSEGQAIYADVLLDLMGQAALVPELPPEMIENLPWFDAVAVDDIAPPELPREHIDRGDLAVELVELAAGQTVEIDLGEPVKVCGLTSRMGPRTGTLELRMGGSTLRQASYDQFCYYNRVGAALFGGQNASAAKVCETLRITQLPDLPDVALRKGEADTGPRLGGLGHLFIETDAPRCARPGRRNTPMKVLVFGFSVTAETGGYVERCATICETELPGVEVVKVAIGGLQPDHARHLLEDVVATHAPDAIIMEVATAVYRLRPRSSAQIADHTAGMEAVFALCRERGMHCGILDLPLDGICDDDDWMAETDAGFSKRYNVPFHREPLNNALLRDNVHPNEEGKDHYARVLFELVEKVVRTRPDFAAMTAERSFGAYPVQTLDIPNGTFRQFSRAGFVTPMLELPEGRPIGINLPELVTVTGLIMLMGPKSGTLRLMVGDKVDKMYCYDRHCYYERVGGKPLTPRLASRIAVMQTPDLPPDDLLKGEKDLGPRSGGITHVLFERVSD